MNSKALIVIALVLIAGVVGVGFVLSDSDSGVAYHSNGGDDFRDTKHSESATAISNPFSKDGMWFYQWNTKADHTGDFYAAGDTLPDTVTDLYAVWTYVLQGDNLFHWSDDQPIKGVLINHDSFLPEQDLLELAVNQYLDPDNTTAVMQFIFKDYVNNWSYDQVNMVLIGTTDTHKYTVGFGPGENTRILDFTPQEDGSVKVDFSYEGNAWIDLKINASDL